MKTLFAAALLITVLSWQIGDSAAATIVRAERTHPAQSASVPSGKIPLTAKKGAVLNPRTKSKSPGTTLIMPKVIKGPARATAPFVLRQAEKPPIQVPPVIRSPLPVPPVPQTPVRSTPVPQTPVQQTPVTVTRDQQAPVDQTPIGHAHTNQIPVNPELMKQTQVEHTPI